MIIVVQNSMDFHKAWKISLVNDDICIEETEPTHKGKFLNVVCDGIIGVKKYDIQKYRGP